MYCPTIALKKVCDDCQELFRLLDIHEMNESLTTRSTFFVKNLAILDQVTSECASGLRVCRPKRACQNSAGHQRDRSNHPTT